jgi:hypothetical protein
VCVSRVAPPPSPTHTPLLRFVNQHHHRVPPCPQLGCEAAGDGCGAPPVERKLGSSDSCAVCRSVVADFGQVISHMNAAAVDFRSPKHVARALEDACSTIGVGTRHPMGEVRARERGRARFVGCCACVVAAERDVTLGPASHDAAALTWWQSFIDFDLI